LPASVEHVANKAGVWLDSIPRRQRIDPRQALEQLGFDGDLTKPCRALSFGNWRKLLLAEALSSGERLIVIDEATAGLDQVGVAGLAALISSLQATGTAFVVADQEQRISSTADATYRLERGRVRHQQAGDEVTVRMTGPSTGLPELLTRAEALGFSPDPTT
jgi:energy-coupling factor transporter ATP-binding protein EcfA2